MAKARKIPGLDSGASFRDAAASAIEVRSEEVFSFADRNFDAERVHDMRVATRRLRAALEILEPCFDAGLFRPALRDVKRLADALGARRDPDVQLEELEKIEAALGARERHGLEVLADELRAEQSEGNARLSAALAEAAEGDLRGRLLALGENARR